MTKKEKQTRIKVVELAMAAIRITQKSIANCDKFIREDLENYVAARKKSEQGKPPLADAW